MVERARIVIADDNEVILGALEGELTTCGHVIVGKATDERSAEKLIGELGPGEVDAFIVDGNYTPGHYDSAEGTRIAAKARDKFGDEVAIFDIGGDTPIQGEDIIRIPKPLNLRGILNLIEDLPEPSNSEETWEDSAA